MRRFPVKDWQLALLAGLLPVLAVNAAYVINIAFGLEACFPYWEGCMSVSRGVRSGPGLALFKAAAVPAAAAMAWCWIRTGHWLARRWPLTRARKNTLTWLGVCGAAFFLVYAAWLGTEGEIYRWLRRYGVVFYFGLTGLAQLALVSGLWQRRARWGRAGLRREARTVCAVVALSWATGVASAFKRKLIDDPAFLDRVENALEWNFALLLSLAFVALAWLLRTGAIDDRA